MRVLLLVILTWSSVVGAKPLVIGSKKFTESVIIAEILRLALKHDGEVVEHKAEFGGSSILWNALKNGDIDAYPEYTGTIEEELLRHKTKSWEELETRLAEHGIGIGTKLGFNNTYALGMRSARALELGIRTVSDLAKFPELRIGLSSEFRHRQDGWPGLRLAYRLGHRRVSGLDHDVAYRALEQGDIDVTDLYTTDAEIPYYDLATLRDDLGYFPNYQAVILYRLPLREKFQPVLDKLAGKISETSMIEMNRRGKIDKTPPNQIAADFLRQSLAENVEIFHTTVTQRMVRTTLAHLRLVGVSMFFAIFMAVPLGVLVAKRQRLRGLVIAIVSTIQTIPALALLVLMIKPLGMLGLSGIGDTPAMIALFLYSLLPILRNTLTGILQVPQSLQEVAEVLNLSTKTRLLKIELPLALPSVMAGIKTALVLNVGFATLGALVGAGGYGQPILTGIRLDDYGLILEGALPAALLALSCQWLFDLLESRWVSPRLK